MHPARFSSLYNPRQPPLPWNRCWITNEDAPPLSSPEFAHAVRRAARTVSISHRASYMMLLFALADVLLLILLSGRTQEEMRAITFDEWRAALFGPGVLVLGSLLPFLTTIPAIGMNAAGLVMYPVMIESMCAVVLSLGPALASYIIASSDTTSPLFPQGGIDHQPRAVAYVAAAAALVFTCLHQCVVACATGLVLLLIGVAEAWAFWGSSGALQDARDNDGVFSTTFLTWADPLLWTMCFGALFAIGGRLTYVRELWMRHETLLRFEIAMGAEHATKLAAALHTPERSLSAILKHSRAYATLQAAVAPHSPKEEARLRDLNRKRMEESPQLAMAGGKAMVDLDRNSDSAVATATQNAASSAIAAAGPPPAHRFEHTAVVCCRVHGCDGGASRAAEVALECDKIRELCAKAAAETTGWVCAESRGPLVVFAYGIDPESFADLPDTASDADKTKADTEAATRGCALALSILSDLAEMKKASAADGAWDALTTNGGSIGMIEADVAIGVSVGLVFAGSLKLEKGTPRHVILGDAVESARTSALHRAPGLAYTDAHTHELASSGEGSTRLGEHLTREGVPVNWEKEATPPRIKLAENEQAVWMLGGGILPAPNKGGALSRALTGADASSAGPAKVVGVDARNAKGELLPKFPPADSGGGGGGDSSRWGGQSKPMPPEMQAKFTELMQAGHMRAAADLVARFEAEAAADPPPSPPPSPGEDGNTEDDPVSTPESATANPSGEDPGATGLVTSTTLGADEEEEGMDPEIVKALEMAAEARANADARKALHKLVATVGMEGRFHDAAMEAEWSVWRRETERRAASKSGKGVLGMILVFALYEAILGATLPLGGRLRWKYGLLATASAALCLCFTAAADIERLWKRLPSRVVFTFFCVAMSGLAVETMLQRNPLAIARATPLFAMLLPLAGYSGATVPAFGHVTVLCCFAGFVLGGYLIAADIWQYELWATHAELALSGPSLFILWMCLLASWMGSMAHAQQRLAHVLATMVSKQEARTAAMLRTSRPASIIEALGGSPAIPLLFHPRASVIVARPIGLHSLLLSKKAAGIATKVFDAWEATMAANGCICLPDCGDVLVAVCGAPKASERHAERACTAALAAVAAFAKVAESIGSPLALRCGVASGRLVSGVLGETRATFSMWGDALLVADALERTAPTEGGVVASQETLEAAGSVAWGRKRHEGSRQRLDFQQLEQKAGMEPAYALTAKADSGPNPFR